MKKYALRSSFVAIVLVAGLCGCGGGGGGNSTPEPEKLSGVVRAPGGAVAKLSSPSVLERIFASILPASYAAVTGLTPVPNATVEIVDRNTNSVVASTTTDGEGGFEFVDSPAAASYLMLRVKNGTVEMRAPLVASEVDITPVSEAVMRVVEDAVGADFTVAELSSLLQMAETHAVDFSSVTTIDDAVSVVESELAVLAAVADELSAPSAAVTRSLAGNYNYVNLMQSFWPDGATLKVYGGDGLGSTAGTASSLALTSSSRYRIRDFEVPVDAVTEEVENETGTKEYVVGSNGTLLVLGSSLTTGAVAEAGAAFAVASFSDSDEWRDVVLNVGGKQSVSAPDLNGRVFNLVSFGISAASGYDSVIDTATLTFNASNASDGGSPVPYSVSASGTLSLGGNVAGFVADGAQFMAVRRSEPAETDYRLVLGVSQATTYPITSTAVYKLTSIGADYATTVPKLFRETGTVAFTPSGDGSTGMVETSNSLEHVFGAVNSGSWTVSTMSNSTATWGAHAYTAYADGTFMSTSPGGDTTTGAVSADGSTIVVVFQEGGTGYRTISVGFKQ